MMNDEKFSPSDIDKYFRVYGFTTPGLCCIKGAFCELVGAPILNSDYLLVVR